MRQKSKERIFFSRFFILNFLRQIFSEMTDFQRAFLIYYCKYFLNIFETMIKEFENIDHLPYLTSPKYKNNVFVPFIQMKMCPKKLHLFILVIFTLAEYSITLFYYIYSNTFSSNGEYESSSFQQVNNFYLQTLGTIIGDLFFDLHLMMKNVLRIVCWSVFA